MVLRNTTLIALMAHISKFEIALLVRMAMFRPERAAGRVFMGRPGPAEGAEVLENGEAPGRFADP